MYFTGDLETDIVSFPPFPGKEKHLLRAQIARISATTMISPNDYYQFADEDAAECDKEETQSQELIENLDYEPPMLMELVDSSLSNWVHHVPILLNQGRMKW